MVSVSMPGYCFDMITRECISYMKKLIIEYHYEMRVIKDIMQNHLWMVLGKKYKHLTDERVQKIGDAIINRMREIPDSMTAVQCSLKLR
jgi:hypothetical protein